MAEGGYQLALDKVFSTRINTDMLLADIEELAEWANYRNEIVHGLVNRNIDAVDGELRTRCAQGMDLAKRFDNLSSRLRYRGIIRKSLGLSAN